MFEATSARQPALRDESHRIAALRALVVLDSPPEAVFDSLTRLASQVCGVPIALISLIDTERQWFKANVGLPGINETPRDQAFCAHAIASDELMQVGDATQDARFADNALVTGAPGIRFYAGAPLVLPGGARVGTLCVIDRQRRQLSTEQATMLTQLAQLACQALVMRRDLINRTLVATQAQEQALADSDARYRAIVEAQSEMVSLADADGTLVYVNPAYARHFGLSTAGMLGANLFDYVKPVDRDAVRLQLLSVWQSGVSRSAENRMLDADGVEHWVAWTNTLQRRDGQPPLLHSVGRDVTAHRRAEVALAASEDFLRRTSRVAGVGGWQLDLASAALHWSEGTRHIHEVADDFVPTLETAAAFYAPEARPVIEAAVQTAMATGQPWDLELPFVTARGRAIWVRAVGEVEFEEGAPVRLLGAFQDITERKHLEQRLANNEQFVRQVTDSLPLRIAYVDGERRYRFVNQPHCDRFGLPREQILGRTRSEILGQDPLAAEVEPHLLAALAGQPQSFEIDEDVGGKVRRRDLRFVPDLADNGAVRGVFTTSFDVTERSDAERVMRELISAQAQAQQQLQRQSATLRSVTEAIPATIAVIGIDGRYRFVNSSFERWLGSRREEIVGRTLAEVLGRHEAAALQPWVDRALAGHSVSFEREYPNRSTVRHLAVSHIPLWLDNGQVDGFVAVAQDITQTRQEEVRLLQLAQRDALTGLLNRAGFQQAAERRQRQGEGSTLALLYVDLDHFKPVNDQHGHPVGDQLLQAFAQRLQALVRPTDAVARIGGDEFAVLLSGVREPAHAQVVAHKVIEAAQAAFSIGTLTLNIGASVGVACGVDAARGWDDLVARADAMLYRAKVGGRGRQAVETAAGDLLAR